MNEQDMSPETRETLAIMRQMLADLTARGDEVVRLATERRAQDVTSPDN